MPLLRCNDGESLTAVVCHDVVRGRTGRGLQPMHLRLRSWQFSLAPPMNSSDDARRGILRALAGPKYYFEQFLDPSSQPVLTSRAPAQLHAQHHEYLRAAVLSLPPSPTLIVLLLLQGQWSQMRPGVTLLLQLPLLAVQIACWRAVEPTHHTLTTLSMPCRATTHALTEDLQQPALLLLAAFILVL